MRPRQATTALIGVAMATTGAYLLVYLFRWQWNRALICGVLFVACEVLLIGRAVLHRLRALDERLSNLTAEDRVRVHVVASRPEPHDRFAWMRESVTRTNVFLPVLLGAGVLASAAAWVVEGVARRTATPALERSLVTSLRPLAFPSGGFVGPDGPSAPPRRPRWHKVGFALAAAGVAGGVAGGIDVLADATQTRPDRIVEDTTTVIDLSFRGARATADPTRHASDLVRVCTSQSFLREIPEMAVLDLGTTGARVLLAADLGDHGAIRLRGCLEDTTLEQIQATVVSVTELPPVD